MNASELKNFLEHRVERYNTHAFIEADPISVPHRFSLKQDIEISGFFASIFAWGQRATIISKSNELLHLMDNAPYQFILQHQPSDLKGLLQFKHRTFNATDLLFIIHRFKQHYSTHSSLEAAFIKQMDVKSKNVEQGLIGFREWFFDDEHAPMRTRKHISSPASGSSCKRLNMYLRWMVRRDNSGVDFGLWQGIKPSQLVCPLDVHVERVAHSLGLLKRKQTGWQAAIELTTKLRKLDPNDPVKYDFALFGLGVMEKYAY